MYKRPLVIKHDEKELKDYIFKFVGGIKPRLKNIEFLFHEGYPMFDPKANELNYSLYFNYSENHSRKTRSTGLFPLFFSIENSSFITLDVEGEIEIKSLFDMLKLAEKYFLSVSD